MPKIKTRDTVKNIKALDKSAIAAERMKDAFIHTKEKAEHGYYSEEGSPSEYATDNITHAADRAADESVHALNKAGQKGFEETKQNIGKAREKIKVYKENKAADTAKRAANQPKEQMKRQAQSARRTARSYRQGADKSIKTLERSEKTIKQSARSTSRTIKSTGKGTVKTAQRSVKTAERTAKVAVKTTQQAAKTAQKTAQATAKAARTAAQAAKVAAKAAVTTAKAAVKATIAVVKAIIAATKALVAAIAAGGWVAVIVIIIICLIGLIVGSCFGIFFSGEDSGTGQTMQTVVREINQDYQAKLDETKAAQSYDKLEMSGSRAVWKEVLAVYAVKTTTDPDNPQEVASVDDGKKELLKSIFWEMNEISSRTESKTETVVEESDDGHGNIVETESTVTRIYLYITVSHKTAAEMADKYGFNAEQREQLAALLADENNDLWSAVLYGIGTGDGEIVTVALSQVGNVGGEPYWSWYGFDGRVEWCACFVSWCANECGYIDAGIIPKYAGCVWGVEWFRERGQWQDNSYTPNPGDIIFFDWASGGQDGESDHTGIVERVENDTVYTVEGNSGDSCRQRSYPIGYYEVLGYGVPAY
ncbi:MAG: CHAP domain-containing protein [Oscillospiraceae bacterium]|nr:CHAP domain-containing protein [Oscillospiraceae bacterium]